MIQGLAKPWRLNFSDVSNHIDSKFEVVWQIDFNLSVTMIWQSKSVKPLHVRFTSYKIKPFSLEWTVCKIDSGFIYKNSKDVHKLYNASVFELFKFETLNSVQYSTRPFY